MKIDMNITPKVICLGDLESGEVFQFQNYAEDYFMASSSYNTSKDKRKYINLSTGGISLDYTNAVVNRVHNARLTNKVEE